MQVESIEEACCKKDFVLNKNICYLIRSFYEQFKQQHEIFL